MAEELREALERLRKMSLGMASGEEMREIIDAALDADSDSGEGAGGDDNAETAAMRFHRERQQSSVADTEKRCTCHRYRDGKTYVDPNCPVPGHSRSQAGDE